MAVLLALAAMMPGSGVRAAAGDPVVEDAEWILTLQVPSGPHAGLIAMNEPRSLCIPYFANMAASGLASATLSSGDARYAEAAWRWLDWYAAHMDASGFVTDYELSGGSWVSTGDYDSTDAYAATFLSAVRAAYAATGDAQRLAAIWPAVRRATDAMLATAAPGYLTYAKPGWNLMYAMDNAEVYEGWIAVAELALVHGDAALRARADEWIGGMRVSLASFWNEAAGAYDVALGSGGVRHPADWSEFYPSVTAQVWMINTGLVPAARAASLAGRIDRENPSWDDPWSPGLFNPPEGPQVRAIGWWPSFADAFTEAGMQSRALAAFTRMRDAALAGGRSWPYHAGSAGRMIDFVVARPDTAITGGPSAWTSEQAATLAFAGSPSAAAFECSLDGEPWAPCVSPRSWTGLGDGPHVVRVRALDAAGHADPIPASRSWIVDTVAPSVRLLSAPPDPGGIGSAVFAFDGADDRTAAGVLVHECSLDGAPYATCVSPKAYPAIATGSRSFRVRARDLAGNVSLAATHDWFADSVAPETVITSGPSGPVTEERATFAFSATDDAPGPLWFECRLGAAAFSACASPVSYTFAHEGMFVFSVRAVDGAGNRDATPASRTWFVDRTPPETTLGAGPAAFTASRDARFTFSGSDSVSPPHWLMYECSLGGAAFSRCTSPVNLTGLADGEHVFEVRAVDASGLADPTPARLEWTIDTAPPRSVIVTPDQAVIAHLPPAMERFVRGTVTDDRSGLREVAVTFVPVGAPGVTVVATISCEDASARSCTWAAAAPAGRGRYEVRVVATDRAGGAESPGPKPIAVLVV
ncbi:MAG TPA: hypothetical protein VM841_13065 [Actinomycetota bacterium]|nr:hypothetical protein [Actinomycetota bacterium]